MDAVSKVNRLIISKLATNEGVLIDDICYISVKEVGSRSVSAKADEEFPHKELSLSAAEGQTESLRSIVGEEEFKEWKRASVAVRNGRTTVEVTGGFKIFIEMTGLMSYIIYNELSMQLNPFGVKESATKGSRAKRAIMLTIFIIVIPAILLYIASLIFG